MFLILWVEHMGTIVLMDTCCILAAELDTVSLLAGVLEMCATEGTYCSPHSTLFGKGEKSMCWTSDILNQMLSVGCWMCVFHFSRQRMLQSTNICLGIGGGHYRPCY